MWRNLSGQYRLSSHSAGAKPADLCRQYGISETTLYNWKAKYGGMPLSEAKRLKDLEDENGRLKRLVADLSLDREALKWLIEKNGWSSQLGAKR